MIKYAILTEAIHPKTEELYKIGDRVVIYQGRFGHNNIIIINSMFTANGDETVYVSEETYVKGDYDNPFPNNPQGTYLSAVKNKMSDKDFKSLQKAKALVRQYS